MKKKIDNKSLLRKILLLYLMLSPIFDSVFLYNHFTTLVRVCMLLVFAVSTYFLYEDSHKSAGYLIAYYLAIGLFAILDYLHSKGFVSLVPGDFGYSILSEVMTLVKLAMPFTILFIVKYQNFSKKDFFRIINVWVFLVAGSIVVCNVCGYSLGTYTGEITNLSIFDWNRHLDVLDSATKGFFAYANQMAILLLVFLVLSIYQTLFENKWSIIGVLICCLALIMLGTRISSLGGLCVLVFMTLNYVIYSLIFKKKISSSVLFLIPIVVSWLILLPISPNNSRIESMKEANDVYEGEVEEDQTQNVKEVPETELEYIENNFNAEIFNRNFYRVFYPYQYDTEFWLDIVEKGSAGPTDYRSLEVSIMKRVWAIDSRWTNYILGLSNSRIQNIVNIEMDFVLHFFAFGLIGSIVVLAYYPYCFVSLLVSTFKRRDFFEFSILVCFGLLVLASFLSGNSLNFLAVIIPTAFIFAFAMCNKDNGEPI